MRYGIIIATAVIGCFTAGCNTIGGLGQDLSETGKALDRAAFWSQNQIQEIDKEVSTSSDSSTSSSNSNYGGSGLVVQEPDTLRQY